MSFGYAGMAAYGFLGVGFLVVMVSGVGLALVYAVGRSHGGRAATRWINACLLVLVIGGVADMLWAVVSGQWRSFVLQFGISPVAEMFLLASLFIGSLWWMAVQYAAGLKD